MPLRTLAFALLAAGVAAVAPGPAAAQKKKAEPPPAGPAVPKSFPALATPVTLGGRPGESAPVALGNADRERFTGGWLSCGGAATADAVAVPAGAPAGVHLLRAATRRGPTNARPFTVDTLPTVAEAPSTLEKPHVLPGECVVAGAADAERSDYFRVSVPAGGPLTVEVLARRLGSPMDPVLLVRDAAGRELPGLYADDTPGLHGDCRRTFTPAGPVVLEVRDTAYRGGPEFGYRLRVGRFPSATAAFPLAVRRGTSADVGFASDESLSPARVDAPAGDSVGLTTVSPRRAGGAPGWPVPVQVSPWPESAEREPNHDDRRANPVPVPGGVSGRFAARGDVDRYRVAGRKDQPLLVVAEAAAFGAPTELFVRVRDAAGKELARSDPERPGARLEVRPPADGDLFVQVEPLSFQHGPAEVYHLEVTPLAANADVTLGIDRADVPAGGAGALLVTAAARDGKAAVELLWRGDARISGGATIPLGAEPKPDAPFRVPLRAVADAPLGIAAGELLARPAGGTFWRPAEFPALMRAAFAGGAPPPGASRTLAVAVVPPPN